MVQMAGVVLPRPAVKPAYHSAMLHVHVAKVMWLRCTGLQPTAHDKAVLGVS